MKRTHLLTLAAVLVAGVAGPALAEWEHVGSVAISSRDGAVTLFRSIGGPVTGLTLDARNTNIMCNDVVARFANGTSRSVFSGFLQRDDTVMVNFPGQNRRMTRLEFDCHSTSRSGGIIDIAGDFDRFGLPRLDPDRYVTGRLDTSDWIPLGSRLFEGAFDREVTVPGARGRDVAAIGLRPLNDDARCASVTATFANGQTRELNIDGRNLLREDRVAAVDLPGLDRNVMRLDMNCHAVHGGQVTIEVLATG